MSTITLSSLKFIKPAILADTLSDPKTASKTVVIDVRDSDHIGGHIKGSQWIPSNELDMRMPELLRQTAGKETIVFHCMLSQVRGPKAALAYARAKQHQEQKLKREQQETEKVLNDGDSKKWEDVDDLAAGSGRVGGQEVCVLEGGFGSWQTFYGEDEQLTDGYAKDLWE